MLEFKDVENEVRRLADESPDYVYKSDPEKGCFYNAGDSHDACIFGQALANLGHPVSPDYEGNAVSAVFRKMGIRVSGQQVSWATHLQVNQDDGFTWREAVAKADATFPLSTT